jgi:hypothetical protein
MQLPLPCPEGTWQRGPASPDGKPVEFKHELDRLSAIAAPIEFSTQNPATSKTSSLCRVQWQPFSVKEGDVVPKGFFGRRWVYTKLDTEYRWGQSLR